MSIEDLYEELVMLEKDFLNNNGKDFHFTEKDAGDIKMFMRATIDIIKSQSDEIADLRQELAKKEDAIDINNIKEVRRINEKVND